MTLLKIIEKASIKTKSPFIFINSIFSFIYSSFCCNLFSSAKISLAFFLVLLSIPVTSVAICGLFKSFN